VVAKTVNIVKNERTLWQDMANLTKEKCTQKCKKMGMCCDKFYCEIAKNMATEYNVNLKETGNNIPFLDNTGTCTVPPYLRPMCVLHQCEIANVGVCADDQEWTNQYFKLREKLENMGFDEHSGLW
jgi:hypothetical protein